MSKDYLKVEGVWIASKDDQEVINLVDKLVSDYSKEYVVKRWSCSDPGMSFGSTYVKINGYENYIVREILSKLPSLQNWYEVTLRVSKSNDSSDFTFMELVSHMRMDLSKVVVLKDDMHGRKDVKYAAMGTNFVIGIVPDSKYGYQGVPAEVMNLAHNTYGDKIEICEPGNPEEIIEGQYPGPEENKEQTLHKDRLIGELIECADNVVYIDYPTKLLDRIINELGSDDFLNEY